MATEEETEMATKRKTFKQFVVSPDKQFVSPDLNGVTDEDLKDAKKYLNPDKTPEEKKKMN